ncbi:MAG: MerR family transcriptional regulator [Polyangia bacterium]
MITPGRLAKRFGLSRTALLHYDSIGLLRPSGRSANRYRQYSDSEVRRLEQICTLRNAGLRLKDIQRVLGAPTNALTVALEERLEQLNGEIERLRHQQRFILGLLQTDRARGRIRVMSKALWTSLLDAAGFSEADKRRWHAEFERQSPEKHQQFLEFLCIPDAEIKTIRARACRH